MCRDQDDRWLARTLELARQGAGRVEPNPRVGAVIVKAGELVASGFHRNYGSLHAERAALSAAKPDLVRGATLYCNLEPCSHRSPRKKQPPCTEAIIAAGIGRVVIGHRDPNPAVRGEGIRALERAGITVDVRGEDADESPFLRENEVFNTVMALGRPFVHLKAAISLDGRLATTGGDSRWITDGEARTAAHRLRAESDAVLVGRGTVEADDPLLTVRLPAGEAQGSSPAPRPVVLDSLARISLESRLVRERGNELLLCLGPDAPERRRAALEARGVTVMEAEGVGGLDPASVLKCLGTAGIRSVFVEGGAQILTAFLRARLYDRLSLYFAPILLGRGREAVGDLSVATVVQALNFESVRWETIGRQQCFTGLRAGWQEEILGVLRESERERTKGGPQCSRD